MQWKSNESHIFLFIYIIPLFDIQAFSYMETQKWGQGESNQIQQDNGRLNNKLA